VRRSHLEVLEFRYLILKHRLHLVDQSHLLVLKVLLDLSHLLLLSHLVVPLVRMQPVLMH
jgi:hypothetical protein